MTSAIVPRDRQGSADAHPDATAPAYSARRALYLGFMTTLVLAGGLFGWGALASISGAVIATGRIEVETRNQVVEHIDGGTVGEILVRDGDRVDAGEVLIRLDDALLRSETTVLEAKVAALAAHRNRLEAEYRSADSIDWDVDLAALAPADASIREVLDGQARLFEARRSSRAGQESQFRERIGQTRKQVAGLEAQAAAAARQRELIGRELDAERSLFEKGLTELRRLLTLEREAARLDGQAGDIAARIAGARGRIAEIEISILQIHARRVEEAESQAREVQARENETRERLAEVRRRLAGMEVRAPVSGEVYGMRVFALGEVVRPGEPILSIVPEDAELMVIAQLEPIHVDQVHVGQEAVLRFSALSTRTTPEFEGRVRRVSASTMHHEATGRSWYELELEMGRAVESEEELSIAGWSSSAYASFRGWLGDDEGGVEETAGETADPQRSTTAVSSDHARELDLTPGMPVEVHVRTGERSPLSYLAKPLTDFFLRSLREE